MSGDCDFGLIGHWSHAPWVNWLFWALATPVQFYTGWDYYQGGLKSLKNKSANMDVLVAMGSSVAYFYSLGVLLVPKLGEHVYFETAAVIITLIKLGLWDIWALDTIYRIVVGGAIGVAMAKFMFGGLGYNAFNPALVGRAFLQAAFPAAMTTWTEAMAPDRFTTLPASTLTLPFAAPVYDGASGATPLSLMKFDGDITATGDLLLGLTSGSTGETCAVLILLGGAYLAARERLGYPLCRTTEAPDHA